MVSIVGIIVVDDKIAEFGESRDSFPADRVESLLRR